MEGENVVDLQLLPPAQHVLLRDGFPSRVQNSMCGQDAALIKAEVNCEGAPVWIHVRLWPSSKQSS